MILDNPILAMNVKVKAYVPKSFHIRWADKKPALVTEDIGNVTAESDMTFEYGATDKLDVDDVPFQVQISYTTPDSSEYMRVISVKRPVKPR